MTGPDPDTGDLVAGLRRPRVRGSSPRGRLAALDDATDEVYAQMWAVMHAGTAAAGGNREYEEKLWDLNETLIDLHKRTMRAFGVVVRQHFWGDESS